MGLWQWLVRRRQADQDLQEEIRSHLTMAAQDRIADGKDREAARLAALKEFGNVALAEEVARRVRRGRLLEYAGDILQDVRYGMRLLAKNPGSRSSRSFRSRLASARTARSSALPMRSCSGHSRCRVPARC
jgi:hypothetical protein